MAHRTEYSKDLNLPKDVQQYRQQLQKQIQKIKQRQQYLIEQNNQKLLVLQKRLIYGKKKIFSFDKQINRMTLGDQIGHYNMQIQKLKNQINKEQLVIKKRKQQQQKQQLFGNKIIAQTSSKLLMRQGSNSLNKQQQRKRRLICDPQQQLMSLTHEIIRLKKSLQQVRSKYSDNFTQYKLKQEYNKLKQQNEHIAQQLKQLQISKKVVNEYINVSNMSDVDYDQLQMIKQKKQYQIIKKQRDLLKQYYDKLCKQRQQKIQTDQQRLRQYKQEKIKRLQTQINEVTKHNKIIQNQIILNKQQIQRSNKYQLQLKGRLSTNKDMLTTNNGKQSTNINMLTTNKDRLSTNKNLISTNRC